MFKDYEIDLKLSLVWVVVFVIIALGLNSLYFTGDNDRDQLGIVVSDGNPDAGQNVEITVFEGESPVKASVLRVNGEEFRDTSGINFTAPQTGKLEIAAEREGLEASRSIDVFQEDAESSGNDEDLGNSGSEGPRPGGSEDSGSENINDDGKEDDGSHNSTDNDDRTGDDEEADEDNPSQEEFQLVLNSPEDQASFEAVETVNLSFELSETANYFIRLNGERVREGKGSGLIEEETRVDPGSYSWFVRAVHDQEVFDSARREFMVEEAANIAVDDGSTQVVDGYILELDFSVENAETYRVLVDGQIVDEGSTGFSEFTSHKFESSGTKEVTIQAWRNNEVTSSLTRSFSSEGPPTAQINWIKPTSPVNTTTPETEFQVDTDVEYDLVYTINEGASATDFSYWEASGTGTQSFSFTPDPLPQGEHDYSIEVRDEHDTVVGESSGIFETTAQREFLQVNNKEYLYDSREDRHLIRLDFKAYEDLSYDVRINGSIVAEESISGTNVQTSSNLGNLQSGQNYGAEVLFESDESSQNLTENLSFKSQ